MNVVNLPVWSQFNEAVNTRSLEGPSVACVAVAEFLFNYIELCVSTSHFQKPRRLHLFYKAQ